MEEGLYVQSQSDISGYYAVLDDDGTVGILYLHESTEEGGIGSVCSTAFAYNRIDLIEISQVKDYRPSPPPIPKGYGNEEAVIPNPCLNIWSISWSNDGTEAILYRDGKAWCSVCRYSPKGLTRAVIAKGPWGNPWEE